MRWVVTSDGGSTVTKRGVCWSTSRNPTVSNYTTNGSGTGTFTSYITGLKKSTRYYVRAYATNANGTSYGNQQIFTTLRTSIREEEIIDTLVSPVETTPVSTLNLYPNPVVSTLTVAYDLPENSNVDLSVFNLTGVKLYSEQFIGQASGTHQIQFDASTYPVGMYVVILKTDYTAITKKFIKIIR